MDSLIARVPDSKELIRQHLLDDPVYGAIIQSKAFQRLQEISFLGAIDHAYDFSHLKKKEKTRYEHSLSVASLAFYIAKARNYSPDIEKHLVSAALLHDIGHMPLSHSIEPVIKRHFQVDHHSQGLALLYGECALGVELNKVIKNNLDVDLIADLVSGKGSIDGADLFSSPINIDTIDGIIRSAKYRKKIPSNISALEICKTAFVRDEPSRDVYLDAFWLLKGHI